MQRVHVHFGAHKTGSTAIQRTLYAGRDQASDYYYPDFRSPNGSFAILRGFMEPAVMLELKIVENAKAAANVHRRAAAIYQRAMAELPSDRPVVISAEGITKLTPGGVARLHDDLTARGLVPHYIGYLRDPASHIRAAFQEVIKTRREPNSPFRGPLAGRELRRSYQRIVTILDEVVGAESVSVFKFDPASFPDGDVVRHFFAQIGVALPDKPSLRVNESLPLLAVKLLFILRMVYGHDERQNRARASFRPFIADLASLDDRPFTLHPDLTRRIFEANTEMIEWSRQRLDKPLVEPVPTSAGGVLHNGQLRNLTANEMDRLRKFAEDRGVSTAGLSDDPAVIGELVWQIRQTYKPQEGDLAATEPATEREPFPG